MPTLNAARKSVQDNFKLGWAGETIHDFDNADFNIPEGEDWVRVVVRVRTRVQISLGRVGNRKFRTVAAVSAQVFVPVETGTFDADRLSLKLANIFDGTRFDGLSFQAAVIREGGTSGEFHQYNVEIPFDFEEIR